MLARLVNPLALVWIAMSCAPDGACAQDWVEARRADPFVYRANFRLEEQGLLLGELQTLEADLSGTLGLGPSGERVELFLFGDKQSYRRFLEASYPGVPYRRALFVKNGGPGRVYAFRSKEFAVDVRHETTHALLHARLAHVPLWLDEGLAEYFEMPASERAGGHPYLAAMAWNTRLGMLPRLRDLERKEELTEMGRGEYRASWAWVHFMLHGPPAAGEELRSYLADLARDTADEALGIRLERRLPAVERRLAEHFATWPAETR
jgi:hypothetical protein